MGIKTAIEWCDSTACFAKTCNYTESGFANPTPKLNQALIVGREVEVDDAVQDPINQT